jgi:hypothetical protein
MKKKWVVLRVSSVLNFYWRESIHFISEFLKAVVYVLMHSFSYR